MLADLFHGMGYRRPSGDNREDIEMENIELPNPFRAEGEQIENAEQQNPPQVYS